MMPETVILQTAVQCFLESVSLSRSANTARTYANGMQAFLQVLEGQKLKPGEMPVTDLKEDVISWMAVEFKGLAPTTERLYMTVASRFFEFVAAENLAPVNLPRVRLLIQQRSRRPGVRLPQFPRDAIDRVLDYAEQLAALPSADPAERLRGLRDCAFLITLADTGLRVHEACGLRRGDVDRNEGRAVIIGKGNREAVVRFSRRAQAALDQYLSARSALDGASGRPLSALPLFARHDIGAGKKIKPITTATGRNIVNQRVLEALGEEAVGSITPHSFRHFFVTRVLQSSGNLKLAQELARHRNIAVTTRYAHLSDDELDRGYWNIFEQQDQPSVEE